MFQILVVEDDRDLNRSVCSFLNQSGYAAAGCLGAAALTLAFVRDLTEAPVAYGVYVLSFYTLAADCVYGAVVLQ